MEISPILLATLGEVALVILIALIVCIRQIYRAHKSLKSVQLDHTQLLEQHAEVHQQKEELEELQVKGNTADLLRETIAHIHKLYTESGHEDLENHDASDFDPSAQNASLVLAYQVLVAQLNAIENSRDAEAAWHNIDEHLQPLLGSLFDQEEATASEDQASLDVIEELKQKIADQEHYIEELESAAANQKEIVTDAQTIESLEQQITDQKAHIATLEQAAADKLSSTLDSEAEQYCTEVIKLVEAGALEEIGTLSQSFNKKFTAGVQETTVVASQESTNSASTDLLHQGLKNSQGEIDDLRQKITNQHETIRDLELMLAGNGGTDTLEPETQKSMDAIKQNLRDSEMCIETMDMEINSAHENIAKLEDELKSLKEQSELSGKRVDLIQDFAQDTKQLLDCITVLEDSGEEQRQEIDTLTKKLAEVVAEKTELEKLSLAFQSAFDSDENSDTAIPDTELTKENSR